MSRKLNISWQDKCWRLYISKESKWKIENLANKIHNLLQFKFEMKNNHKKSWLEKTLAIFLLVQMYFMKDVSADKRRIATKWTNGRVTPYAYLKHFDLK